jgi:hypothetical protein
MIATTILLATWAAPASAADIHVKLTGGDGALNVEESWDAIETFTKRYGPLDFHKVPTVWSVTAQPSIFDALTGTYQVVLTACVKWNRKGQSDEHCEKYEVAAGPTETVVAQKEVVGKGVKFDWAVSTWYTGETPPSGLPAPEPRPIPGQ